MNALVSVPPTETRGRKSIFEDDAKLNKLLMEIKGGSARLTHYMKHQLAEAGWVSLKNEPPPGGGRGRPTVVPTLTDLAMERITEIEEAVASDTKH